MAAAAEEKESGDRDSELRRLIVPDLCDLPPPPLLPSRPTSSPTSPVGKDDFSYVSLTSGSSRSPSSSRREDFLKPGHDQYIHRHANGLCVVGLAASHVALKEEGGVTGVDFNVGRSDRSEKKVTGKRKRNALHFEPNSAICKVNTSSNSYVVRCCVKGSLLEVNERLIKQPELLNSSADREGFIAIIMPKPADWLRLMASFLSREDYRSCRGLPDKRGGGGGFGWRWNFGFICLL
ncbi:unnamed protein product [Spirodela intermedia]|uniref:Uncharacterized protein n=1 Tax=Spirodela intermedia TaxID=51605 RepID=A0A7I8JTJ8_SPIIN|nr:unnamed protein product [Spirodela intermedia]CAA6673517.1 unnamed protein product [Spirodela intermedia]